jgi:signal transduction histidine kinase
LKLKNRFILIIVGVFVVPLLVSMLVVLFNSPNVMQTRLLGGGDRRLSQELGSIRTLPDLIAFAQDIPDNFFMYIFDDTGEQIFHSGSATSTTGFHDNMRHHLVFSRNITMEDGLTYSFLAGTEINVFSMPFTGVVIMLSILLFLSILSSLTLRAVNNSVKQLVASTRRIANGDLDTPVTIEGNDETFVSLANSFDDMRKKVKEEQERQMRFFMGVSHDLKTPLSSITGYSEALLDGLAEDEAAKEKYLKIINAKGKLLEQRITHLIGYMKVSTSAFREELETQPIVPFLEEFVDLQQDESALLGFAFESEISIDSDTRIAFDRELLARVMENLLQNCLRYGMADKPVRMFCRKADGGIVLGFSDYYKKPLDPALKEHMFEPFCRGDQSRKGEGLGLGLASVKSIIESHGWTVKGYSDKAEGTTVFEIRIPLEP